MKRSILVLSVVAAVWAISPVDRAWGRLWRDASGGFSVEAELVDCRDGVVRLKKTDGQIISVPLGRLSTADQAFIRKQSEASSDATAAASDSGEVLIEFLTGAKSQGQLVKRDAESISIRVTIAGRSLLRVYPLERLHAITIGGRREVLQEMPSGPSSPRPRPETSRRTPTTSGNSGGNTTAGSRVLRTRNEVEALIDNVGSTPPDWWDSVPLDYPQSLDLSWPEPAPGPWNAQKNVGQYIWEVINPNPGKWKSGVRFLHHLLTVHEKNPQVQIRVMESLARTYQNLFQDYPRAAFWWRKVGAATDTRTQRGINLATCYWELGNKQMAVEQLNRSPVYYASIKLWADMGETQRALQYAEAGARGDVPDLAYLYAGDACRGAGQYRQALAYYEKCLQVPATGKTAERTERNHKRAQANIDGIKLFELLDLQRVPDGSYRSESPGFAGQIKVEVTVQSNRIESVKVTEHHEKQFFSSITETPRKIIEKQGVKGVDTTSSATITSEAIINATAKALAGGMK